MPRVRFTSWRRWFAPRLRQGVRHRTREVSPAGLKRTQDLVRGVDTSRVMTLAGGFDHRRARRRSGLSTPGKTRIQRTIMAEHLGICSPRPSKSKDAT